MLDKVQISHITTRVKDIFAERVLEIQKEFPVTTNGPKTIAQWAEAIKNGQVEVNPAYLANPAAYPAALAVTQLSSYLMEKSDGNKNKTIQEEKIKALKTERDRILDELVLGDAQEAVKMLGKFREFKV